MKRNDINQLYLWFRRKNRKPLILRGARQVGKSTLVRNFVAEAGLQLIELNMEQMPLLDDVFKTNNPQKIMSELLSTSLPASQELLSATLDKSLLFIDEIQATPHALPALRYLAEAYPRLPIITAGSLLEFVLAKHSFSMPVGRVEYLHLGPMRFSEFLLAVGDQDLVNFLTGWRLGDHLPLTVHQRLLNRQREYLFVGGMPEAILQFTERNHLADARVIHRTIMQSYQDDFAKYARHEILNRLHRVLTAVPRIVGKKVKYVTVSRDDRAAEVRFAIDLLIKARLLLPTYHSDCSGLPIKAGWDDSVYKLYFLDCGLLSYLCGLDWQTISNLDERTLINEGVLAEQFVAQHLAYREQGLEPPELSYWLRENRSANAEVDFVIAEDNQIKAVEVKAGKSGSLKSLLQFLSEKKIRNAYRFDLNLPSSQNVKHKSNKADSKPVSFLMNSLPLYLVEKLNTRIEGML